ncbi:MAG: hypothetical protein LC104_04730, partial [Bacteroidales bacterium]|nr:hypothetical protein [Bacteroidales bacterium]
NLRVADWHTYFVGGEDWGWAAWVHNQICGVHEGPTARNTSYNRAPDELTITDPANLLLQAERIVRHMPAAGSANDTCTLAYVQVGSQRVFASNTDSVHYNWPSVGAGQVPQGQGVNNGARYHAEVKAMVRAVQAGVSFAGQDIVIFTDRDPCKYCDKERGIENAARLLGARSVTIWCPTGGIGQIVL